MKKKPNIKDVFSKLMDKMDMTTERVENRLEINKVNIQNHDAMLKNLVRQMGQIHDLLSQRQHYIILIQLRLSRF